MMMEYQSGAASRYSELESVRQPILRRGREAAKLTIPSLLPPSGHKQSQSFPTPYQGIGAMGVNNLASKLLLALLPPNSPFFRMKIDDFTLSELTGKEDARAEVEKGLQTYERALADDMEGRGLRPALFSAKRHLIVGGNVLIHIPIEGTARVFSLDQYVVKRDPSGNVLEIIVKESLAKSSLPAHIRDLIETTDEFNKASLESENSVDLYTHIKKTDNGSWSIHQEIEKHIIEESKGSYPKDKLPWLALRWTRIDGEDYGRGMIEEYFGDLKSLEGLMKALVEGTAISAKTIFMVAANAVSKPSQLAKANNGDFVTGDRADVEALRVEKGADFQVAFRMIEMLTERLSMAFLLNSAVQRDAERVTAEEVRYVAGLLEDSLGGLYSLLSQELQLPLVTIHMHQLKKGKLKDVKIPDTIKPVIVTGLEALGRTQDIQKLQMFADFIQKLGPEGIKRLNIADLIMRVGTNLSIDIDGLVYSEEQVAEKEQQMMVEQMATNPQMLNQINQMSQEGTPQDG